jgi:hypothetical protein
LNFFVFREKDFLKTKGGRTTKSPSKRKRFRTERQPLHAALQGTSEETELN